MAGLRRGLPSLPGLAAWLLWLALGAVALGAALRAGYNVPVGQDWRMVPAVTGHEAEPVHWLWHQDGNDRHPVGRALTLATISTPRLCASPRHIFPCPPPTTLRTRSFPRSNASSKRCVEVWRVKQPWTC